MCRIHEDVCEMLSLGMCECTRLSMSPPPLRLPKEGFCERPVLGFQTRWGSGFQKAGACEVLREERSCPNHFCKPWHATIMLSSCTYLVSHEKHRTTLLSVTSAKGCSLLCRSGLHKKTTFAMCFQHLNPDRHICFPRNCFFEESRRWFHFWKGS